jgi:serine/threonine-protein kinase SRPK3
LIISTDLKGDHFMLPFDDPEVLHNYVRQQEDDPAPFRERHGRPVFESRPDFGYVRNVEPMAVQLTDFGLAVRGDVPAKHNYRIQPFEYRAPEVMLKAGWSYSADIWNLGLVVRSTSSCPQRPADADAELQLWELLADVNLLEGKLPDDPQDAYVARFARMIRLLGSPPQKLLETADKSSYSLLYDHQGTSSHLVLGRQNNTVGLQGIFDTRT